MNKQKRKKLNRLNPLSRQIKDCVDYMGITTRSGMNMVSAYFKNSNINYWNKKEVVRASDMVKAKTLMAVKNQGLEE